MQVGAQHGVIDSLRLVSGMADENGAGDVGAKARLACAEIEQQRIARLDRVVGARMGMRTGRIVARRNDRAKGMFIRAVGEERL